MSDAQDVVYNARNPPPYLAPPRSKLLKSCCCCKLRTGVMILTVLAVVLSVYGLFSGGSGAGQPPTKFALQVVLNLIEFGFAIVGFLGAYNYRLLHAKIYMVWSIIAWVISLVGIIVSAASLDDLARDACASVSATGQCEAYTRRVFWIVAVARQLFSLYFTLVVYSFWRQLFDTFALLAKDAAHANGADVPPIGRVGQPVPQGDHVQSMPAPLVTASGTPTQQAMVQQPVANAPPPYAK